MVIILRLWGCKCGNPHRAHCKGLLRVCEELYLCTLLWGCSGLMCSAVKGFSNTPSVFLCGALTWPAGPFKGRIQCAWNWKRGQHRIESSGSTLKTEAFALKFPSVHSTVEEPRSPEQISRGLLKQFPMLQVRGAATEVLTGCELGREGDLVSPAA